MKFIPLLLLFECTSHPKCQLYNAVKECGNFAMAYTCIENLEIKNAECLCSEEGLNLTTYEYNQCVMDLLKE